MVDVKQALVLLLFFASFSQAQTALDLSTQKQVSLDLQKKYLFVQENCEACEKAMLELSRCNEKIKNSYSIVAMESEPWAKKLKEDKIIKNIKPTRFYLMTYAEAKKINVMGTPTYWPQVDKKLKPKTCRELGQEVTPPL